MLSRKKRILLFGGRKGLDAYIKNACMLIGNSGDDYGFVVSSFGTMSPTGLIDGTAFHTFTADSVTKLITLKFGAAGTTQLEGVNEVLIQSDGLGDVLLTWNATNSAYELIDTEFADNIEAADGDVECYGIYALPDLFIHYDFETIYTQE